MSEDTKQKIKAAYDKVHEANIDVFTTWEEELFLSWEWWLGLALFIAPWIIWIIYRNKNNSCRLLLAGFTIIILSSWFDFLGITLGAWYYPVKVIPTIPSFEMWDFSLQPVIIMFLLQIRPQMNPLIKALVYGGLTSFVGEPLFEWIHFYEPLKWKHIYSFVIYTLLYLLAHFVSRRNSFGKIT